MALDIFHLSYKEPYSDQTWERLSSKFPYARRVQGVKGIFEAHKRCAELAYTCLLYTSPSQRDGLLSLMPSSA